MKKIGRTAEHTAPKDNAITGMVYAKALFSVSNHVSTYLNKPRLTTEPENVKII